MDIIQLAIVIVIICAIIAIIQIVLPQTGLPSWVRTVLYILLFVIVIVYLLRMLGGLSIDL